MVVGSYNLELMIINGLFPYQVLSAMSALKMIKYLYAKFLYLFGLASNNPAFADSVASFAQADPGFKTFTKV